jgi:hypothetical protein
MRFMLVIPWTELSDELPRVQVKFFEAPSKAEGHRVADELSEDARALMDETVWGWRDNDEWKDLDGEDLLSTAGYAFGWIEVWSGEGLLHTAVTEFGPCDLYPPSPPVVPTGPGSWALPPDTNTPFRPPK